MAEAVATRSEDPFLKVGAVVLRPDRSVASVGYNGAPSGIRLDWSNRDERRKYVIHAEANALRFTSPAEVKGGLLAVTHATCDRCLPMVAAYGIARVIFTAGLPPIPDRPTETELIARATILGIQMGMPCKAIDEGRSDPYCRRDWPHQGPHLNRHGGFFYTEEDK